MSFFSKRLETEEFVLRIEILSSSSTSWRRELLAASALVLGEEMFLRGLEVLTGFFPEILKDFSLLLTVNLREKKS